MYIIFFFVNIMVGAIELNEFCITVQADFVSFLCVYAFVSSSVCAYLIIGLWGCCINT
jgi:hypothetical protein